MKVRWTQTARDDLKAVWDFISRDSIFYANKFTDELLRATDVLEIFPEFGRIVPEIGDANTREIIYGSYRIMYLVGDGNVFVTQIVHGARDFKPEYEA